VQLFGAAYRRYRQQVPTLVPFTKRAPSDAFGQASGSRTLGSKEWTPQFPPNVKAQRTSKNAEEKKKTGKWIGGNRYHCGMRIDCGFPPIPHVAAAAFTSATISTSTVVDLPLNALLRVLCASALG
jgi:hypothetical protein